MPTIGKHEFSAAMPGPSGPRGGYRVWLIYLKRW